MQRLPSFLMFLLFLSACAVPATPTLVTKDTSTPESDHVILDGTFETSLLVTEWKGDSEGNVLFPLDPASGKALPDYAPISLGQSAFHAFSPDRGTLAVVSFPNQNAYPGSLSLIDLATWTTRRFELDLAGWVSTMVFSPDGKRLAIAHGDSRHKLTVVDVEKGVITAQRETDWGFVSRLQFTRSGAALMLYGPVIKNRFTENEMSAGPPQILLLGVTNLNMLWSFEVKEVHDGIFPKDENVTPENIHEPGQAFYFSPGLAFAPDRDALYIVHADSEQLTTVDFESQTVKAVDIEPRLTRFERLLSLFATAAHAKIGDGITRQAVVSPDGQFLYVVGSNSATFQDQQGNWQMEQTPLGLEIIQTRDGVRVEHLETDTTEISISPDGHFLYLRNWGNNTDNIPWTEIYERASQELLARKDKVSASPVFLMNGEFLLASSYSTSETSHHMSILQPDGSSVLAEWTDSDYIYWLTMP